MCGLNKGRGSGQAKVRNQGILRLEHKVHAPSTVLDNSMEHPRKVS